MTRLTIILVGLTLITVSIIVGFATWSLASDNAVKDARDQATAAVIYAQMTPSMMPSLTPYGTPTISPYEVGLTQFVSAPLTQQANEERLALTKDANELALEREKLRVAQAAIQATADEKNRQATVTADSKTAIAYNDMQTSQASSQKTAIAASTHAVETAVAATRYAGETSVAAVKTERIAPTHDMLTLQADRVVQTAEAGEAMQVKLAVERTQWTNLLIAFGPWAFLAAIAYVAGRGFSTWVKTRTHSRDEHGRRQAFQRELPDGGVIYMQPEQLETGIVKVTGDGNVIRYGPIDKQEQSNINRGNQIADIVAALPAGYAQTGKNLLSKFAGGSSGGPSVDIAEEARGLGSVLEEAEGKIVAGE